MKSFLLKLAVYGPLSFLIVCGLVYFGSNYMIFVPPKPSQYTTLPHLQYINTSKGKIAVVYLDNPKAYYTILYSHGNAADLKFISSILESLYQHGFSVLGYDYNGYGMSEGSPSEANTYANVHAMYEYLTKIKHIEPKHIILMGHSVGTGPTVELATHVKAAGMIIESAFMSAYRTQTINGWPLLLFDKFKNIDKIKNVHIPVLIIHGANDELIPLFHGKRLFKAANNPKFFMSIKGAGHNNYIRIAGKSYWQRLDQFVSFIRKNHVS